AAVPTVGEGVVASGRAQGVGGGRGRRVAGAPAQVARRGGEAEAVGPDLVLARTLVGRALVRAPAGTVELGGHGADEARRAVAALRTAAHGHLALHGVERVGAAQALDGADLLAVQGGHGDEAGVDGDPLGGWLAVRARARHEDGAGAALPLGAAFLGAGQASVAEPVQRGGVWRGTTQGGRYTVH